MKKLLMILLAAALVFSMVGVVVAEETEIPELIDQPFEYTGTQTLRPGEDTDTMIVEYVISDETFLVTIPDSFAFNDLGSKVVSTKVIASDVTLIGTNFLNVTVDSEHDWKLVKHKAPGYTEVDTDNPASVDYTLDYYLNGNEDPTLASGSGSLTVLTANPGTKSIETRLVFTLISIPGDIGTFKDKLTFTASIESKQ